MSDQQEKDTLELFEDAPGDGAGAPPVPDFEEEIREVPPAENTPPPPGLQPRISDIEGEESFGQYLRALRERNHFTIAQIADETKIKSDYLEALENEDYGCRSRFTCSVTYENSAVSTMSLQSGPTRSLRNFATGSNTRFRRISPKRSSITR